MDDDADVSVVVEQVTPQNDDNEPSGGVVAFAIRYSSSAADESFTIEMPFRGESLDAGVKQAAVRLAQMAQLLAAQARDLAT